MIKKISCFFKYLKERIGALWKRPVLFSLVTSFVSVIIIESLGRHSFIGGFEFLIFHPLNFLSNMIPVAAAFSFTYLFKKRIFAQIMVGFVLAVIAIINFVLLFTRINPLEAMDFSIIRTGIAIIHVYLNTFEIIACGLAIIAAIVLIIFAAVKTPKVDKVDYKKSVVNSAILVVVSVVLIFVLTITGFIPSTFKDKIYAYDECGFLYCFTRSIFDRGISEPEDYSPESVDTILDKIDADNSHDPDALPNIIMIQLESFMDPNAFVNVQFEKNPVPNFTKLKENYINGILHVPSVGSGTANTEFEVLTGMNLEHFGMGEYPYQSILQDITCETICYNLSAYDYTCHAFHNHTGTFYDRNIVYEYMGFNTFTPIEYMNSYDVNPLGWAKDYVLEDEIIKALDSTKGNDFVFAVSVQGHGKYPDSPVDGERLIGVSGVDDEEYAHQLSYYAYQLYEMDEFIGNLVNALTTYGEDCMLVLYGDHQPSIEYNAEDISFKDKHASEYIIWTNFDVEEKEEDLEAYQLSSYALGLINIDNGILNKLHQKFRNDPKYDEYLELIEYDSLYGDKIAYGGEDLFEKPGMTLGLEKIKIDSVSLISGSYYLIGDNFTQSSYIYVNDSKVDTVYISPTVLLFNDYVPQSGDVITVSQITTNNVILGTTKAFNFTSPEKLPSINPDLKED